jgi:hypothetical protein
VKRNESGLDRVIRVILGIVLLALNVTGVVVGSWGIVFIVVGILALFTGVVGFCPVYWLLRFKTNKA